MVRDKSAPPHIMFTRMPVKQSRRLWAMWKALGWTQVRLSEESGVDIARISSFHHHKRITAISGAKIAIAVIGAHIELADRK